MMGNQEGGSLITVWASSAPRLLIIFFLHQTEKMVAGVVGRCASVLGAADAACWANFDFSP